MGCLLSVNEINIGIHYLNPQLKRIPEIVSVFHSNLIDSEIVILEFVKFIFNSLYLKTDRP